MISNSGSSPSVPSLVSCRHRAGPATVPRSTPTARSGLWRGLRSWGSMWCGKLKRKIAASQLPPPEVPYAVPVPAAPVSAPLAPLADDDILERIVEDPSSRASTPLPSSQPQTTPQPPAMKKRKRHSDDSTVTRLEERARTSAELQQEIRAHLREATVPTCPRVAWGRWITTLLLSIHESIWSDFMRDSINLMIRYSDASQRLHHQPQVMVQQQMPAQMPVTPQQMLYIIQCIQLA
uniref:uncharacterized protein isoform X1 n=1 Tax=Myxine glutinosa TaxID=7769 RepID=UPI00358FF78B